MASRKLQVEIVGDASSLKRAFGDASKSTSRFGSGLGKLAKVAAVGVGAAFVGLAAVVKKGMDEIGESQKVAAQTAATLKATGGIANVTADHVAKLSQSLSDMSSVDDELVQSGANLLLTFKNVRNEIGAGNAVFDRATRSALDLSQAGFGSVESASKMLGKALNDPVKGMTALGRAGVTFSASQKTAIADLVKTGDTLGAQKLILKEIESQVGGSAKAYGETLPGQLAKARNSFDEMAANVAAKFLPALTSVLSWVNAHWPEISAVMNTVADAVAKSVQAIAAVVGWLAAQWNTHRATIMAIWASIQLAVQEFSTWFRGSFLPAVQNVVAIVMALWDRFGAHITLVIQTTFNTIRVIVSTVLGNIASIINAMLAVLRGDWSEAWSEIKEIPGRLLNAAVVVIRGLVGVFLSAARAIGTAVKDGIVAGVGAVASWMGAKLGEIQSAIQNAAEAAGAAAVRIGQAVIAGVLNGLSGLWNAVKSKVESTLRGVLDSINPFSPVEHGGEIYIGAPIVAGAVEGINKNAPQLPAALSAAIKRIAALAPAFYNAGLTLGESLAVGLLDARGKVIDAANELSAAVARSLNVAVELPRGVVGHAEARRDQIIGRIPGLAAGGIVNRPTLALIGESGPEAVVPLRGSEMVGATVMNFSFPNYVGDRDQLIREVRAGLAEVARDNPNIFAGKA